HFTRLHDELAGITTGLVVPTEPTPWPTNCHAGPRRAAVSSDGISGTNVHAIVEQAPDPRLETDANDVRRRPPLFLPPSTCDSALRQTATQLAEWVEQQANSIDMSDLAYTLARRRGHRTVRSSVVASDATELCTVLRELAAADVAHPEAVGHDDRGPVW